MTDEKTENNQNASKASSEKASPEEAQMTQDLEALAKAFEENKNKAEDNWNLYLRARADIENVRRRAQSDIENAHKYSIEKFARELLAVVDSLEHGLAIPVPEDAKALHEGMELTLKLLLDTLDKYGVKSINPVGETFNPASHEALSMQVSNEVEPNKILFVAQKGFLLHDRVIRPARVIVAKAAAGEMPASNEAKGT